jgi:putative tricarboxylic transport membrane protein
LRRIISGCLDTFKYPGVLLRGTVIGIVMGIIPGVGSAVANLISYAETKRSAKDSDTFGKGNPKGVIGAEAAVASGEGGSMATMLTLGIPGHGAVAVLLAAFMMHNVVAGPSLIRQHKPMVYALILNNIVEAVALLGVGLGFIYVASNVVRLRTRYIVPVVLILAIMGTYSLDGTISGPITLFVFTLLGAAMVRYKYPVAATVVGLLLGRMLETQAVLSYEIIGGQPAYILHRPGAIAILLIMTASLGMSAWSKRRRRQADKILSAQRLHDSAGNAVAGVVP